MFTPLVLEIFSYLLGGFLVIFMVLYIGFGYGWIFKYMRRSLDEAGVLDD